MELSNHCKYKQDKICSFVGFAECKDAQRADPEECILYQLIEDNRKLKQKV